VACVVTRFGPKGFSYSTYSSYLDSVTDELAERGYSVVFERFHIDIDTHDFIETPRVLSELGVDGTIAIDSAGVVPPHVDERLAEMGAPAVWVNRTPVPGQTCVVTDDYQGARRLTRHLIDLGHRRIGYVGYVSEHYSSADRHRGVLDEMRDAGLDPSAVVFGPRSCSRFVLAERAMSARPAPTGVICQDRPVYENTNYLLAREGLRVPGDVSVAYFASPWEDRIHGYATTCIRVPELEMAASAVRLLFDRIAGRPVPDRPEPIVGTLIPGQTAAPPETCP
jgi:LacI family transcriptional regulator